MNEQCYCFSVEPSEEGERLDLFLSEKLCNFTRSYLQKVIQNGGVTESGKPLLKSYRVCADDEIVVSVPQNKEPEIVAQDIPLEIVYEDTDLIVINKPKGMVVHPAPGNPDGTLVNALMFHCHGQLSGINGINRPGIVHRIDRDTSGLVVAAKSDAAHLGLAQQFSVHEIQREYYAIAYGHFQENTGTVNMPIGRHKTDRKKMAVVSENGKNAVTHYTVLESLEGFTYLKCTLETGRTHQIRVHMAALGHPLAGDAVYGPKKVITALQGQCLHAKVLGFTHPITGQQLVFDSTLPDYFSDFLRTLRNKTVGEYAARP